MISEKNKWIITIAAEKEGHACMHIRAHAPMHARTHTHQYLGNYRIKLIDYAYDYLIKRNNYNNYYHVNNYCNQSHCKVEYISSRYDYHRKYNKYDIA